MLYAIVLVPLVGTVLCQWVGRVETPWRRAATAAVAATAAFAACVLLLCEVPAVFAGQVLLQQAEWAPAIGLNANLRLDALGWMFAALITGIGLLIIVYAAYYLQAEDPVGKFFATLMLFMAAMLGIVLSDNLLLLVVFWELTSVSSFLLVGYWGQQAQARAGARMALTVTGFGGLALLAGIVLLGQIAGTHDLSAMLDQGERIRADARYPAALGLILLGCFTKSAQLPFHFWLPEAMAAPTPASAYLHSATMVKAGVFLLARLYPVLGGSALFETVVAGTGLATMLFAAYVAVFKHDLKGLLAYSTISHLGLIVFLIGLDSPLSAVAAMFHVLNHATFKAALFMTAGIVDHETGTRDMRRLGGLARCMPWTAALATVAAAAMAGVPLLNGFLSKEMMFDEALRARIGPLGSGTLAVMVVLAAACSVAYSLRFVHDVFFNGAPRDLPKPHPHEPPLFMKLPVGLLAATCVAVGVLPGLTLGPLVHAAASAMLGAAPPPYRLALWHGFNAPLAMSLVGLLGGTLLYLALQRGYQLHLHHPRGWTGRLFYTHGLDALMAAAARVTRRFESGSLQSMLAVMLAVAVGAGALPFVRGAEAPDAASARALLTASPVAIGVWLLLLATGAALLRWQRQRYVAVVLAGAVGLVASLAFVGLSAPDLAMTQLSVDVICTVLLLMALALLPQSSPREMNAARKWRHALIAAACGIGMAALSWQVLNTGHDSISWYFIENALGKGGGSNVVNVILVDFRGYDTFGEIAVLGIAGVGMLAVLGGLRARRPARDAQGRPWSFAAPPLLLRQVARLVLPLALLVSAYLFWRGHNLPGGGFIAGLVTAAALLLQYMALGQVRAEALLQAAGGRRYVRWIGIGLGLAWLTGVGALVVGRPFLTSAHGHGHLPLLGDIALASAALFDLGVYLTVVGATMLMLSVLGAAGHAADEGAT